MKNCNRLWKIAATCGALLFVATGQWEYASAQTDATPVEVPATPPVVPTTDATTTPTAPATTYKLGVRGFEVTVPGKWQREAVVNLEHVLGASLKRADGHIIQTLLVQSTPLDEKKSLPELASALAKASKGTVSEGPQPLDGHDAVQVTLHDKTLALPHQVGLMSNHGKRTFLIIVSAPTVNAVNTTLESLRASWHWLPFAAPTSNLAMRSQAVPVCNKKLSLLLPQSMGRVAEGDGMLAIDDARTGILAFVLIPQVIAGDLTLTLTEMRDNYDTLMQEEMNLTKKMTWRAMPGQPDRTICELFEAPAEYAEKGYTSYISYGLVKMPKKQWGLLTFTMTGQTAADRKLYQAAMLKIFASVKVAPVK